MPRSAHDATRFTATGPYVSNKPGTPNAATPTTEPPNAAASSNKTMSQPSQPVSASPAKSQGTRLNPIGTPVPANETSAQKIQRLRAAAQLARTSRESTMDRTIRVGRLWADRAHRITALSLIGLTVVSGVIATAGITDMLMHNRRKRNEWLAEQEMKTAREVAIARRDLAMGNATEEQILLINRERARDEAEEARRNRPGILERATGWLGRGLSKEEERGGKLGSVVATASSAGASVRHEVRQASEESRGTALGLSSKNEGPLQRAIGSIDTHRKEGAAAETKLRPTAGILDQQAQQIADAATDAAARWTRWLGWR